MSETCLPSPALKIGFELFYWPYLDYCYRTYFPTIIILSAFVCIKLPFVLAMKLNSFTSKGSQHAMHAILSRVAHLCMYTYCYDVSVRSIFRHCTDQIGPLLRDAHPPSVIPFCLRHPSLFNWSKRVFVTSLWFSNEANLFSWPLTLDDGGPMKRE